jgi:hypothetical protein
MRLVLGSDDRHLAPSHCRLCTHYRLASHVSLGAASRGFFNLVMTNLSQGIYLCSCRSQIDQEVLSAPTLQ